MFRKSGGRGSAKDESETRKSGSKGGPPVPDSRGRMNQDDENHDLDGPGVEGIGGTPPPPTKDGLRIKEQREGRAED
jgi:hypothetical protein